MRANMSVSKQVKCWFLAMSKTLLVGLFALVLTVVGCKKEPENEGGRYASTLKRNENVSLYLTPGNNIDLKAFFHHSQRR